MPSKRAALAKLTRPRLHAPLKRARLFKLLDRRDRYPIAWVAGPPGSGKTTLVASYLEVRKVRTHWYQVDEGDRDPATFFHYLSELAHQSGSRRKKTPLPVLTADHLRDLAGFTRRFARALFARLGTNSVLVLDNCQDAASETFNLILREVCEELPPGSSLIALSRMTLPDELARQGANQRAMTIGWRDLRLTANETAAIAKRGAAQVKALHQQCDGWVAGLVLLLAHQQAEPAPQTFTNLQSKEALFAYFAGEILSRTTPEARELLLCTALLPYTTPSMACEISSNINAGHILQSLYEKQYFIERKVETQLTYQYHDLFREFLLQQLERCTQAHELAELRRRAAEIMQRSGELSHAVALYSQASEWADVALLIRAHAEQLLDQGRWRTLDQWFAGMPEPMVCADPWLLLWCGYAKLPQDLLASRTLIEAACGSFGARGDRAGEMHALFAALNFPFLVGDSLAAWDKWLPAVEDYLSETSHANPSEVESSGCAAYLAIHMFRGGNGRWTRRAAEVLSAQLDAGSLKRSIEIDCVDHLLHYSIWAAIPEVGARCYAHLAQVTTDGWLASELLYFFIKDLGYWHFFNADYPAASEFFARAAAIASEWDFRTQIVVANCYRAMSLWRQGEEAAAQAALQIAATTSAPGPLPRAYFGWAAGVLTARTDPRVALEHGRASVQAAQEAGFSLLETICSVQHACYALEAGEIKEACAVLSEIRPRIRGSLWRLTDAVAAAINAELLLRSGDEGAALVSLREALQSAQAPRVAAALDWVHPWLPRQFALALREDIEPETVRLLVRRFNVPADASGAQFWPWPIKIRTLGAFQVELDGAPLSFAGKAPKKTLALLKALIAFGGRGVEETELIDALWPDSEGDAGYEALKITVLRLRKLLQDAAAVELKRGQVSLDTARVWVDAFAFSAAAEHSPAAAREDAHEHALRLYRGEFLPGEERQAWLVPARERLRRKFVELVVAHGKHLERGSVFEEATHLYLRGLDADDLIEEFYQGLMRCHLARGQCAEGMDVFRRLRQILSITLSISPSDESQALFLALQRASGSRLPVQGSSESK